ncbi:leucine-rich repeat protein [Butyrivibrio proteoclasticus]|uniref:leucine-rich repeat protein n=1 Tax=Butyrivibrio proteoclasticus TaxID=43305 RepID=UPI0006871EEE|nr:leucine-rich repeat domain-containing protein [Butyrivibrio proteoclasticus]
MLRYEIITDKTGSQYAEITGYDGMVKELSIPEEIDGLPVKSIGNHAFSGRDDITSVILPGSIKILRGFAFHNCKNLEKIVLFDSLQDYYDGVCRQCDNLKLIELTVRDSWYEVVRNFLADSDKRLHFLLHQSGGDAYLTFPEFVYDFNENTMARTIQFSIAGSGYAYRECVDRRRIDYREYDSLFKAANVDGSGVSQEIALGRLLYPVELSEAARDKYCSYVKRWDVDIVKELITEAQDSAEAMDKLTKVLALCDAEGAYLISDGALSQGTQFAVDKKYTKVVPVLMDARKTARASEFSFEL